MDGQEFQIFYQENLGAIYRFVLSKVGSREDAEDLTSHIFMKALNGLDENRTSLSRKSWLFQVARTTVADYWRVAYRAPTSSLQTLLENGWEEPAEEDAVEDNILAAEQVERILQGLSLRDREVLTCRFLLHLSLRETAQRMGLTETNVKVVQYRALKRAADLEPMLSKSAG